MKGSPGEPPAVDNGLIDKNPPADRIFTVKNILIVNILIIAFLAVAAFIILLLSGMQIHELHSFLASYYVYLLEFNFFLLLCACFFNIRYIREICREIGKKPLLLLLLLAVAGMILVSAVTPRHHRSFYDEDIYNSIGQCIASPHKRAVMCNEGYYENGELNVATEEYNKQPAGYPHLISIIFRIFGTNEIHSFVMNNVLFGLTIIVVFFISFLLFKNTFAGLMASLAFFCIPANLQWFNTSSVEPAAAFFAALAVFALLLYIRNKKPATLFFFAVSLAFSFNFRTESIIIAFVALLVILLKDIRILKRRDLYIFGVLFLILSTGIFLHLYSVRDYDWGAGENVKKISTDFLLPHLSTNTLFYFNNAFFPVFFTLLAITGLVFYKNREHIRDKLILLGWFVVFWAMFLVFYAGEYNYNDWLSIRFTVLTHVPLSILIGLGASFLRGLLTARFKRIPAVLPLLVIANLVYFMPYIRSEAGGENEMSRMDHHYAMEFISLMPGNSIIYTHNPNMFLIHKQSAVQTSSETYRPGIIEYHRQRFNDNVYIHYNYWSNFPNDLQRGFTELILNKYKYEIIKEYYYKQYKYGLYKITGIRESG
ncbi:MAG: glycosyltransferase family 39 protein [Spirochaetales bacterium]|nr:glycosyltransferase family 39 protein [Spirochaetales bacterium]